MECPSCDERLLIVYWDETVDRWMASFAAVIALNPEGQIPVEVLWTDPLPVVVVQLPLEGEEEALHQALSQQQPLAEMLQVSLCFQITSPAHGLPPQKVLRHAPYPADELSRELLEKMAELCLFDVDDLAAMSLDAAVLSLNPAGQAFRGPVTLLQNCYGPVAERGVLCSATTFRAQTFSVAPQAASDGATWSNCFAEACG